jgi:hypothetical protein
VRFEGDTREERDCVHGRLVDFFLLLVTDFSFHTSIPISSSSPQLLPPAVPHLAAGAAKAATEYIYRPNLEGLFGRNSNPD